MILPHPEKTFDPIFSIEFGILIISRFEQLKKAKSPIDFRLLGNVTVFTFVHSRKASFPISIHPSGIEIVCKLIHLTNAPRPIDSIELGK